MKLSRPIKLLVGAATLWLPLYMLAFIATIFAGVATHSAPDVDAFEILFRVHMATMVLSMGLLAFYVVHLFKATHLASDQRIMWALVILFFGPFAMPVYFVNHVWPEAL
ncbi:MAG TPA: hypothetical protein VMZ53_32580 [Kofleriaceae bacterium]|nr:hypothetical protein [Kofleriaceae bacterium]